MTSRRSRLLPYIVLAAGSLSVVAGRLWLGAGRDWSVLLRELPILVIAVLGTAGLIYALVVVLSTRLQALAREIKRAQPDAIVLTSGRTPQLPPALKSVGYEEQSEMRAKDLPMTFCLVGNPRGVELWGGSPKQPYEYFHIPWASVVTLDVADINEYARTSRGLMVVVHDAEGTAEIGLPFIVTGRGPGRIFPQSRVVLEGAAAGLLAMKDLSPGSSRATS